MKQESENWMTAPPPAEGIFPGVNLARLVVFTLACCGILLGCAELRKATYPSDFVYLERKQVVSQMALMSLYMQQIDEILLDQSTISSEQQARIVRLLTQINQSAAKLGAGSVETSHLVLDAHIDEFQSAVYAALRDASADPPNYFALGRLSGSCAACHKYR